MKHSNLRRRAEAAIAEKSDQTPRVPAVSSADLHRLVEELQVHQMELELQNEELKAARLEAERAREQYCELFEAAPAGYIVLGADGVIVDCNAAARTILCSADELIGRRFDTFITAADHSRLIMHLEWARECKRAHSEMCLTLLGERSLTVRLDTSPLPSEHGKCLVVLTDMSERQRNQELLEQLNQRLESRVAARTAELRAQNQQLLSEMEARTVAENQQRELEARLREGERLQGLGMLAAGIAHDFNNLLVSVVGNADLLLSGPELPEEAIATLSMIRRTGLDASELTRQLLVFAGQGRLQPSPVHLSELLRETVDMLRSRLNGDMRVRLDLAQAHDNVAIAADRSQLQRVILNLLSNAIEALNGSGEIVLSLCTEQLSAEDLAQYQHARAAQPGEFIVLSVEDTGAGIESERLTRIFEPFFSTKFTGRGLGLATTLGIVQSHEGALRVRSAPGKGTRFDVALPKRTLEGAAESSLPRPENWRATGVVLLIDDDRNVGRVVARQLRRFGFEVFVADGGGTGLQLFDELAHVDLVVLDWMMPDMTGDRVLQALRQRAPKQPVLLMSGYQAETLGCVDEHVTFLQKPMTREQLIRAIHKLVTGTAAGLSTPKAQPNVAQPNVAQPNVAQPNVAQPNVTRK